jgi:hypothetical protein
VESQAGDTQKTNEKVALMQQIASIQAVVPSGMLHFYTQFDNVRQFHEGAQRKGNCFVGSLGKNPPPLAVVAARCHIIKEEFGEDGGISLLEKLGTGEVPMSLENLATLLDWICDMNYFFMGLAINFGLPYDAAFEAVHGANMKKVVRPGGPVFREDGKVVKPEGWVGPEKQVWEIMLAAYKESTILDPHQKPGMPQK